MNLNTLAKLAGVSVATVSKAFSGREEISAETRDRIFAIARAHGCFDKYNKNKFDKKVIAVICPELNSDYYNAYITILNREIEAQGGLMTVSVHNFSHEKTEEMFAYYSSYCKADGIIVVGPTGILNNPLMIPAVAIGTSKDHEYVDSIFIDFGTAIMDAIYFLKAKGHTRIGFAGETLTGSKEKLFRNALRHAGIPLREEWIKVSEERFEKAGITATDAFLKEKELPTAILASYDNIAIGMIKSLQEKGIRVPEDISVIGMDDIAVASFLETSLSSIRTHTDEACRLAVELIMKKLKNQYYSVRQNITIASEFIPRDSSAEAPNGETKKRTA